MIPRREKRSLGYFDMAAAARRQSAWTAGPSSIPPRMSKFVTKNPWQSLSASSKIPRVSVFSTPSERHSSRCSAR